MIMTELLPLKAYLSILMKAVAYSVQAYSFYCIYNSSSVIRQNFSLLKQSHISRSIVKDKSRSLGCLERVKFVL